LLKTRFGEISVWRAQVVSPDLARPCWIRRSVDSVKGDVVAANERRWAWLPSWLRHELSTTAFRQPASAGSGVLSTQTCPPGFSKAAGR